MTITVVIPAINEADALRQLLPALRRQQGIGEVIVVDGGSRDETPEVAEQYGVALVHSPAGRARQMNAGAAQAQGETLWFLHADSRLPDTASTELQSALDAGAEWGRFDVRLSGRAWLLRVVERLINWRSCLSGIATGDQGIFLPRRLFESLGGYAEIPLMEDVELSRRLKRIAKPCCIHTPLVTSSRRWEHYGIVRTIVLMWLMRLAYFLGVSPAALAQRYRRSDTPGQGS